jgi:hypothetical protein
MLTHLAHSPHVVPLGSILCNVENLCSNTPQNCCVAMWSVFGVSGIPVPIANLVGIAHIKGILHLYYLSLIDVLHT